jgi:tyrosine-specific transport protein
VSKLFGGIMLIVGTSIGGGMLALPVSTSVGGFIPSVCLLITCWVFMLMGALCILEANLWLPEHSNLVSMARATLGRYGEFLAWVVYLALLYALLAVYITGGGEIAHYWLERLFHCTLPLAFGSCLFAFLMGYVVYRGIVWVDFVNRGLLSSKLMACLLLIVVLVSFVQEKYLLLGEGLRVLGATTVAITSLGFAAIVPSLRAYFKSDAKKLRFAIILGSAVPLFFYIIWVGVVQGVFSIQDERGLSAMRVSGNVTTHLTAFLSMISNGVLIKGLSNFFVSVCVLTSFLGVALCMTDFLADGFKVVKQEHSFSIILGALLPPLILVLFVPSLFLKALAYGGILCIILLVLFPAMMVYSGRYIKKIAPASSYRVMGGKPFLLLLILLSFIGIGLDIFYR